jgi:glycosyltransferase involved in cell wall biosynthesis
MKIAVIPAYNEESVIGSVVLKTKKYVDKIIVVDDGSRDDTARIAELAGAEVFHIENNLGYGNALYLGLKRALELKADITIVLDADYTHDPEDIPTLISPIEKENVDISIGNKASGFRAFSQKALYSLVNDSLKSFLKSEINTGEIDYILKTKELHIDERWIRFFKKYDEHIIDKIEKLNTTKEIFNEERKVQKNLSRLESYKLICETFLKFIPPAILSLIISLTIIIPATNFVHINISYALLLAIPIILTFLFCWAVLIKLLDKIYEKSTYLEALDRRLKQKEGSKSEKIPDIDEK